MIVKYKNGVIAEFSKPQYGFNPVRIDYNNSTSMYQEKQEYLLNFKLQDSKQTQYCKRFVIYKHFHGDGTMYRWRRYFKPDTMTDSPEICEVIKALETYIVTQSVTDFDYFFQPSKESGLFYEILDK